MYVQQPLNVASRGIQRVVSVNSQGDRIPDFAMGAPTKDLAPSEIDISKLLRHQKALVFHVALW